MCRGRFYPPAFFNFNGGRSDCGALYLPFLSVCYNINADAVAGAVAGALRARRLIMLTDVAGVLDPEGKLIQSIRVEDAAGLYENGTVTGGMIPKLNCCIDAIEQGVEKVMIVDGRVENCVLLELLTDQGVGTEIVGEER